MVLFLKEYLLLKPTLLFKKWFFLSTFFSSEMYFSTGLGLSFGISHLTEQCVEVGFYKGRSVREGKSYGALKF